METDAQPSEQPETVLTNDDGPKVNTKEDSTGSGAPPPLPNSGDLATTASQKNDGQKPSPKKPKKRKPKVPRDVTAPRQPLTGNVNLYNIFKDIYSLWCTRIIGWNVHL